MVRRRRFVVPQPTSTVSPVTPARESHSRAAKTATPYAVKNEDNEDDVSDVHFAAVPVGPAPAIEYIFVPFGNRKGPRVAQSGYGRRQSPSAEATSEARDRGCTKKKRQKKGSSKKKEAKQGLLLDRLPYELFTECVVRHPPSHVY